MTSIEELDPIEICFRCGHAITRFEIKATFEGTITEWDERIRGDMVFHLCNDCRNAAKEYVKGGVKKSIERRKELEMLDHR